MKKEQKKWKEKNQGESGAKKDAKLIETTSLTYKYP